MLKYVENGKATQRKIFPAKIADVYKLVYHLSISISHHNISAFCFVVRRFECGHCSECDSLVSLKSNYWTAWTNWQNALISCEFVTCAMFNICIFHSKLKFKSHCRRDEQNVQAIKPQQWNNLIKFLSSRCTCGDGWENWFQMNFNPPYTSITCEKLLINFLISLQNTLWSSHPCNELLIRIWAYFILYSLFRNSFSCPSFARECTVRLGGSFRDCW